MRRESRLGPGKKTREWEHVRKVLKRIFQSAGITTCELHWPHHCWRDNGLSFAHAKKRRYLKGDEIYEVALLCPIAHSMVERLPHKEMEKIIKDIIQNRERRRHEHNINNGD